MSQSALATSSVASLHATIMRRRGFAPTVAVALSIPTDPAPANDAAPDAPLDPDPAPALAVVPPVEPSLDPVAPNPAPIESAPSIESPTPAVKERKRQGRKRAAPTPAVEPAPTESLGPVTVNGADARFATKELRAALTRITAVADRRSHLPIFAHTMLSVRSGRAELVATNLNITLTVPLRATHIRGVGSVLIPAHHTLGIAKVMTDGETTITKRDARVRIFSGRATFDIPGMPPGDFPKIPDASADDLVWAECDADTLASMIKRVRDSVCQDETRFHLAGGFLECDGRKARLTATDGHRLTSVEEAFTGPRIPGVIIPEQGLTEIAKLDPCNRLELALARGVLFARQKDGTTLTIKLIDAQYPPYEQVIPKDHTTLVSMDRIAFVAALKRALLVTSNTRGVKFHVAGGEAVISADNGDGSEMSEALDAYIATDVCRTTGFNPSYLLEAISPLACDRVTIAIGAELDPILIRSSEFDGRPVMDASCLVVVMPMRI